MLKGIDPLLTPELLANLCSMGHGEWVAVVDANFTAVWLAGGKPVVRLPGHSLERVAEAILSIYPLAQDVSQPVAYMQHSQMPNGARTVAQEGFCKMAKKIENVEDSQIEAVERYAFYERVKTASLIVQTGESSAFGNGLLCKGVILN